jgi:zinc transport system permease protein
MQELLLIALMTFVAAASGLVGSFALNKRMTLVADAFSHVALPGLGLALLIHANPLYGGIIALLLGAAFIWLLQEKSHLPTENVVGMIFIFSLALGALLTPKEDLIDALFGGPGIVGMSEFAISIIAASLIMLALYRMKEKLTLIELSPEISKTMKVNASVYNFLFLLLFSLTVILGLKFLGVLLMGALIIIPSAIAKLFSWSQNSDILLSMLAAVIAANTGLIASMGLATPLGPTIAIACFVLFVLGLILKMAMGE